MPPATVIRSVASSGRSAKPSAATAASTWRVLPAIVRMSPRRISVSGRIGISTMFRVISPEIDAAREGLIGQLANRLAAEGLVRHEHVDLRRRDIQQPGSSTSGTRLDALDQHLVRPETPRRRPPAGRCRRRRRSAVAARTRSTKTRTPGKSSRPAGRSPESGVDPVGAQLDRPVRGEGAGLQPDGPPPSSAHSRRRPPARSTPISFGPSWASRTAEPIVPKM